MFSYGKECAVKLHIFKVYRKFINVLVLLSMLGLDTGYSSKMMISMHGRNFVNKVVILRNKGVQQDGDCLVVI